MLCGPHLQRVAVAADAEHRGDGGDAAARGHFAPLRRDPLALFDERKRNPMLAKLQTRPLHSYTSTTNTKNKCSFRREDERSCLSMLQVDGMCIEAAGACLPFSLAGFFG